jgi:hypothetical protein
LPPVLMTANIVLSSCPTRLCRHPGGRRRPASFELFSAFRLSCETEIARKQTDPAERRNARSESRSRASRGEYRNPSGLSTAGASAEGCGRRAAEAAMQRQPGGAAPGHPPLRLSCSRVPSRGPHPTPPAAALPTLPPPSGPGPALRACGTVDPMLLPPPITGASAPRAPRPTPWFGEVAEWSNAPHSKCGIGATLSGVRISPSPPIYIDIVILFSTEPPQSPNWSPNALSLEVIWPTLPRQSALSLSDPSSKVDRMK